MNDKKLSIPLAIICVFILFMTLFPFLWGFFLSFKTNHEIFNYPTSLPESFDFSLYPETFRQAKLAQLFMNSLSISIVVTIAQLALVFLSSFAIARLNRKFRIMSGFFYYLFLAAAAVPPFVLIGQIYMLTIRVTPIIPILGIDSLYALAFPYIAGGIPFCTLMLVGAMRSIPDELEDAALIDGCKLPRLMWHITFPLVTPILVALVIFTFLGAWNEYPFASILLNTNRNFTLPLAMAFLRDQFSRDFGAIMRAVLMILIPQVIFYLIFQRKIIEGMATTGLKM